MAPTTEQIAQMRLLAVDIKPGSYLLTDEEYGSLFLLEGENVRLGAAAALELMATSHVMLAKKITTQDLSIDGVAVAESLRKSAALLRARVAKDDAAADQVVDDADSFGFDFVDFEPHRAYLPSRWGG